MKLLSQAEVELWFQLDLVAHTYSPSTGKRRQDNAWGTLANQPGCAGEREIHTWWHTSLMPALGFCHLDISLDISRKKESWVENCLHQTSLWASLGVVP